MRSSAGDRAGATPALACRAHSTPTVQPTANVPVHPVSGAQQGTGQSDFISAMRRRGSRWDVFATKAMLRAHACLIR